MPDADALTRATLYPFLTRIVACFATAVFASTETTARGVDAEDIIIAPVHDATTRTLHVAIDFADNARRRTVTDATALARMIDDAIDAYRAGAVTAALRVACARGVDVMYARDASRASWTRVAADAVDRPEQSRRDCDVDADFDVDAFTRKAFVHLQCRAVSECAIAALEDAREATRAMAGLNAAIARHRARLFSTTSKSFVRGFSRRCLRRCALVRRDEWCACVSVSVSVDDDDDDDDDDCGAIEVWIDGSMLPRKASIALVAHALTIDARSWAAFALPALRLDARRDEANAAHAVWVVSDRAEARACCEDSMMSRARVRDVAISFASASASARDMHAATMPLSRADARRTSATTLLNPVPMRTASALITTGVFDALRLLKMSDDDDDDDADGFESTTTMFWTREEHRARDAAIASARAAFACLDDPVAERTREFLAEHARARGADWRARLLLKIGRAAAFRASEQSLDGVLRVA